MFDAHLRQQMLADTTHQELSDAYGKYGKYGNLRKVRKLAQVSVLSVLCTSFSTLRTFRKVRKCFGELSVLPLSERV